MKFYCRMLRSIHYEQSEPRKSEGERLSFLVILNQRRDKWRYILSKNPSDCSKGGWFVGLPTGISLDINKYLPKRSRVGVLRCG